MNYRYFSILDGASLTNEDIADTDLQYFGYTRPGGSWAIMKYDKTEGTYLFRLGGKFDDYNDAWTNRASSGVNYKMAGEYKRL